MALVGCYILLLSFNSSVCMTIIKRFFEQYEMTQSVMAVKLGWFLVNNFQSS